MKKLFVLLLMLSSILFAQSGLKINDKEYFTTPGLDVMVFSDYYPEGHQTGVTLIQHGVRVVANGDVRLEPSPGQWSPIPILNKRNVDKANNEISAFLSYPDPKRDKVGFNPIDYPDLKFNYTLRVKPEGNNIRVFVDFEQPIPEAWVGKIGFNIELFPGLLYGKSFLMDNAGGIFPPQTNGPLVKQKDGSFEIEPIAKGKTLIVAPECDDMRVKIESLTDDLYLIDGGAHYNNGWFVVRTLVPAGKTKDAIELLISPNVMPNWIYKPVVQISQVGYHPQESKIAVIETDKADANIADVKLIKFSNDGSMEVVLSAKPQSWGDFLRYKYYKFDFTKISDEGMYQIQLGDYKTAVFPIAKSVFQRHVWQPTLEYYLPIQMCHMKVSDRYKVWHGLCHVDDGIMAPVDFNLFDGFSQGPSTYTSYKPLEHIPNLTAGGWHDAGDLDFRVESQAGEVQILSQAYEEFNVKNYDETTINQEKKEVFIHQPDGKSDLLQQIEHGALTVVNGYKSLGRFYRGIVSETKEQYTMIGDCMNETDNLVYNSKFKPGEKSGEFSGIRDDRYVFTEDNPMRDLNTAACLAAGYRSLKNYNPELADDCIRIAEEVWKDRQNAMVGFKVEAAAELYLSTKKDEYKNFFLNNSNDIIKGFDRVGASVARVVNLLGDESFKEKMLAAAKAYKQKVDDFQKENPYGVPYRPNIWGDGWNIQEFGKDQYYLHAGFPEVFSDEYMINALNFVLGTHPGTNTASFASGVGANSVTVAYGYNRADWTYIPGGVVSGTAMIRPDLPELKEWPYFWQQTEYVMGGGATNFMFMVLAADKLLNH